MEAEGEADAVKRGYKGGVYMRGTDTGGWPERRLGPTVPILDAFVVKPEVKPRVREWVRAIAHERKLAKRQTQEFQRLTKTRWGPGNYFEVVKGIQPSNLYAYWPMDEASGATVALDYSGRAFNGAYTAVTLGQPGIGDGRKCPLFDGATSFMQPPAGFRTAFNSQAGTLAVWVKMLNSGVWSDATNRYLIGVGVDANNYVALLKQSTAGRLEVDYVAGGTVKLASLDGNSDLGWFHFALTWNKAADELKLYKYGVQQGATVNGLGVWVGTPVASLTVVGAQTNGPANIHSGYLAHAAAWSVVLPDQKLLSLARV